MANTATSVVDLDFQTIKGNLQNYLSSQNNIKERYSAIFTGISSLYLDLEKTKTRICKNFLKKFYILLNV